MDIQTAQREVRRNQRQEARKLKIVQTASDLIDDQGLEALTIRTVAAEAGYTPAALYPYFVNRRGLIEEVFLFRLSRLLKDAGSLDATGLLDFLKRDPALLGLATRALDHGRMSREAADRLFTGKVIALFQNFADSQSDKSPLHVVGLAALVLGLSVLEGAGRLEALNLSAQDIIDHWSQLSA